MPFEPTAPRAGLVRGEHLSFSVPERIAERRAWIFRTLNKRVARDGKGQSTLPVFGS